MGYWSDSKSRKWASKIEEERKSDLLRTRTGKPSIPLDPEIKASMQATLRRMSEKEHKAKGLEETELTLENLFRIIRKGHLEPDGFTFDVLDLTIKGSPDKASLWWDEEEISGYRSRGWKVSINGWDNRGGDSGKLPEEHFDDMARILLRHLEKIKDETDEYHIKVATCLEIWAAALITRTPLYKAYLSVLESARNGTWHRPIWAIAAAMPYELSSRYVSMEEKISPKDRKNMKKRVLYRRAGR